MDLTRAIGYRGTALNSIQFDAVSRDMVGCEVRSVEYGNVRGVGYEEKRAMADGTDVADIYQDKRVITMAGTVYGRTRAEAFRIHTNLADILNPADAYEHYAAQRGYSPLDFYMPTDNTTYFPSGLIHAMLFARPVSSLSARFDSDVHGGDDNKALAIPWTAVLDARVPDIVNYDYTTKDLTNTPHEFSMRNRGTRPATIEMRLVRPAGAPSGWVSLRVAGDTFAINFPYSGAQQVVMYDTRAKVLTLNGVLRMDLLVWLGGNWHPVVHAGNISMGSYRSNDVVMPGSYVRFRDTWA